MRPRGGQANLNATRWLNHLAGDFDESRRAGMTLAQRSMLTPKIGTIPNNSG